MPPLILQSIILWPRRAFDDVYWAVAAAQSAHKRPAASPPKLYGEFRDDILRMSSLATLVTLMMR